MFEVCLDKVIENFKEFRDHNHILLDKSLSQK